jgi:hypothetical protein
LSAFVYVQGLFVWWCSLRRVMYHCYFFLYDIAVLLLLFKKNAWELVPSVHDVLVSHCIGFLTM